MQTGDGLLVRFTPTGTIPLDTLAALCAAAQRHGNGVIEVTARGNIQVRGLSAASAPRFAGEIAALAIAAADGVPIVASPLAGLDPEELFDAGALAADLRRAFAAGLLAASLSPKVSVAIDSGGALSLDHISADVRARAELVDGVVTLKFAVGGDGANATTVGSVFLAVGVEAAIALLRVIAQRGRNARARDIVGLEGAGAFRDALRSKPVFGAITSGRENSPAEAIGAYRLRDGSFARGIGLAFGHTDAKSLVSLVEAARRVGSTGIRTAGKALLLIGLPEPGALLTAAATLGFIVRSDDPRRAVFACAGAPVCASAQIASRALAPLLAGSAAPDLDGAFTIHVSGCPKGCAHPGAAALTIVGMNGGCALIADGRSRDTPFTTVPVDDLPAAVAAFARIKREAVDV